MRARATAPGSAIGTRAAADAQHDASATRHGGVQYGLAEPVAGGTHRVGAAVRQPLQSADRRQFDDRLVVAAGIARVGGHSVRPRRPQADSLEAGPQRSVQRPVAAVGHRQQDRSRSTVPFPQSPGDVLGHLRRGE